MENLQVLGYSICGTSVNKFFEYFIGLGYKWCRTEDYVGCVKGTPDFLSCGLTKCAFIYPIPIIYEFVEELNGRENICYGVIIKTHIFDTIDNETRKSEWRQFEKLLGMYSYKYGKPIVVYDEPMPDGYIPNIRKTFLNELENINEDLKHFCEFNIYSKIVEFRNEIGRIYIGLSYDYADDLTIVYIDNKAEKIGQNEYNYLNSI